MGCCCWVNGAEFDVARVCGLLGRDDGYKGGIAGRDGGCGLSAAALAKLLTLERMRRVGELVWVR